ncbi:MAG TPA: M50 family metallopeptidase [Kofleriaceae bacterium]|nr:M50 family metallopeptidase [Kofleriaceae bacterium]
MDGSSLQKQRALVIALLASLLLWNLPFGGLLLYPFKLLSTWLHEGSHALVMVVTGAGFDRMEVFRDTSGLAYMNHGVMGAAAAAIAAAGYMGTPLFGAVFLVIGQTRRGARSVLLVLGLLMGATALLFISNTFGIVAVLVGAGACLAVAAFGTETVSVFLVNFIAAQACINAVLDIRVLFRANMVVNGQSIRGSDAHNMAAASFGTPTMWASIWLGWSFLLFFVALRVVYLRHRSTAPESVLEARPRIIPVPVEAVEVRAED